MRVASEHLYRGAFGEKNRISVSVLIQSFDRSFVHYPFTRFIHPFMSLINGIDVNLLTPSHFLPPHLSPFLFYFSSLPLLLWPFAPSLDYTPCTEFTAVLVFLLFLFFFSSQLSPKDLAVIGPLNLFTVRSSQHIRERR